MYFLKTFFFYNIHLFIKYLILYYEQEKQYVEQNACSVDCC